MKAQPKMNDNFGWACARLMRLIRKDFPNKRAEIHPHTIVKYTRRFESTYGISHNQMLDALIRRGWFEPSAADTFIIRYDLAEAEMELLLNRK